MNKSIVRIVQVCAVFALGLYATFVCLGNLMDYGSNWDFVKHVLSMDTTFEGNALMWRAITNEGVQMVAYWGIILTEAAIAVCGWVAGIKMLRNLKKGGESFERAKVVGYYAFLLGLLLWFVGFICIGSEWFAMWQSSIWNGKQTAMDITEVIVGLLIIYMLPSTHQLQAKK